MLRRHPAAMAAPGASSGAGQRSRVTEGHPFPSPWQERPVTPPGILRLSWEPGTEHLLRNLTELFLITEKQGQALKPQVNSQWLVSSRKQCRVGHRLWVISMATTYSVTTGPSRHLLGSVSDLWRGGHHLPHTAVVAALDWSLEPDHSGSLCSWPTDSPSPGSKGTGPQCRTQEPELRLPF